MMESLWKRSSNPKTNTKGQFFIMSLVLIALAMFLLMTFFLSIGESSAIMFEKSSRIELNNIQNSIDDPGICYVDENLCAHFLQIYGGKFQFNCSDLGESSPFNYSITLKSKDLNFYGNFTQNLDCTAGAVCGNGVREGDEWCDSGLQDACIPLAPNYYYDDTDMQPPACDGMYACRDDCMDCITQDACEGPPE